MPLVRGAGGRGDRRFNDPFDQYGLLFNVGAVCLSTLLKPLDLSVETIY